LSHIKLSFIHNYNYLTIYYHACDNMGPHSFLIYPFVCSSVCFSIPRNITDNWHGYTIFLYVTHTIMSEHKVFRFVHLFVCLSIPRYTNYRMTLNDRVDLSMQLSVLFLSKQHWNFPSNSICHFNKNSTKLIILLAYKK
jgi:hypothetical protein